MLVVKWFLVMAVVAHIEGDPSPWGSPSVLRQSFDTQEECVKFAEDDPRVTYQAGGPKNAAGIPGIF